MRFLKSRPVSLVPLALTGIPVHPDTVRLLHSAREFRAELLLQISQARQRIYLCSLYLQNDEAGAEILAALYAAKAARPGLEIKVLVDSHRAQRGLIGAGQHGGNALWYQEQARLNQQTGVVPIYGVPVQTRELFGVLHLKGFVIDDRVIYSGASLNNVYLHQQDKYRHDRYLIVQNSALADCMAGFIREHLLKAAAVQRLDQPEIPATRSLGKQIRAFREQLKRARYQFSAAPENTHGLSITPLVGVGKDNPLNLVICQLLAASQKQITICTPYFNFPRAISSEIGRALQRGVKIDILVGDKSANDFYVPPDQPFKFIAALPYLYEKNLRRFAKAHQASLENGQLKLHLWRDAENTYHLKGVWIDQEWTLMTGNNLNPRAFRLDLENALLIHDPQLQLLAQRQAELDSIFHHTRAIKHYSELEKLQDYPPEVRKFLRRLSRTSIDRLAYRVL